ncbi:MAG: hypothetical protein V3S97_04720 [Candidatus Bathyarchaeia archaeon]
MSSLPFTIKIRFENNEIEVSGSKEDVLEALNNFSNIMDKLTPAFNITPIKHISKPTIVRQASIPSISVEPNTPCPEALLKILSTEWGKEKPRKLRELLEVMKVNAIHYPVGTVKGRLTDLTKKGALRRVKEGREYGYIRVK